MQLKASNPRVSFDFVSGRMSLTVDVDHVCKSTVSSGIGELQDKPLSVEIKKYRNSRSLDANKYLWALCDKIAIVLKSTKEEVYRKLVRSVGKFDLVSMPPKAAESFKAAWNSRGLGWYAEREPSDGESETVTIFYGSSCYDTQEFSRLIDEAISEAKALDIETATPAEIALLKEAWGK